MSGEFDFDWGEQTSEPGAIHHGVLQQWGQVVFGRSMPGPHKTLECRFRITRDELDINCGLWRFVIPARLVSRITYYRDFGFYGMQIHHRGAEGVPPLMAIGSLDRELLAKNLRELGYRVVDESTALFRSAPGEADAGPV